jgi:hypothetical protein
MQYRRRALSASFEAKNEGTIIDNYMTIVALEDGVYANLNNNPLEYCIDGSGDWVVLPKNTNTPSINKGQTISFRGECTISSYSGIGHFTIKGECNLMGNCNSLLFGDNPSDDLTGKTYAFSNLFRNNLIVEVADDFLPATILADACYSYMFQACDLLVKAPKLPAMTLANSCYGYMFEDCDSLEVAPDLPAQNLIEYCYISMFNYCSKLKYVKALFIELPSIYCTMDWLYYVPQGGTFVKSKDATWDKVGSSGIPSSWNIVLV